jgi:mRNA-degrading endonuclease RelE of RelBE toxin-antitoxin system
MPIQIQFTALFKRRLNGLGKRYRNIKIDIQPLLSQLLTGKLPSDQIAGTNYNVYKVRAKNSDTKSGRSGGYRVIYQVENPKIIVLHLIYSKSDQATITAKQIQEMIKDFQIQQSEDFVSTSCLDLMA